MSSQKRSKKARVSADQCGELSDKTVAINRVSKVVRGGRRFSFSALVVTGDGRGHFGYGLGKASEVPDAIRKASEQARKSIIRIPLKGTTVPFDATGHYGPTQVILRPASPGTGVIAGSAVRAIAEVAGIKDIRTKCIGSNNTHNVLHATLDGLISMRDPGQVAEGLGMSLEQMGYAPF